MAFLLRSTALVLRLILLASASQCTITFHMSFLIVQIRQRRRRRRGRKGKEGLSAGRFESCVPFECVKVFPALCKNSLRHLGITVSLTSHGHPDTCCNIPFKTRPSSCPSSDLIAAQLARPSLRRVRTNGRESDRPAWVLKHRSAVSKSWAVESHRRQGLRADVRP